MYKKNLTFNTEYSTIQKEGRRKLPGIEKIINKMKRQPNGIRQEEADKVLTAYVVSILNRIGK